MKKTVNIITTALLVLVLLVAFALVGVRLFGIAPYTVLSGSMEPTYHVGSLIYVKEVDVADLKVGDPLTYVIEGGTVVTHRIIEILPDYGEDGSPGFKTKGDNNRIEDGTPVHSRNVLGKPIFNIPLMGYAAYFIQNPPGSFLAIGFCIVIVLLTFVPDLVDKLMEDPPADEQDANGEPDMAEVAAQLKELKKMIAEQDEHPPDKKGTSPPDPHPPDERSEGPPGGKNEHPPNNADALTPP